MQLVYGKYIFKFHEIIYLYLDAYNEIIVLN